MPDWLVDLFTRYGYAVVFAGVFLENAGVPIPGETAVLAGAALASFGHLSLSWVVGTAIVAAILGDNVGFFIGRRGGRALAERYGHRIGLTSERLSQFDQFFARYGGRTVFIARFVTGLRVFGAVLAGGSRLSWPAFLFYNASGAIVWSATVGAVGFLFAYSWQTLDRWIAWSGLAMLVCLGLLMLTVGLRRRGGSES